jgi:pimeloyl-ACP methyl ester carboxylesterase
MEEISGGAASRPQGRTFMVRFERLGPAQNALVMNEGEEPAVLAHTGWRSQAGAEFWRSFARAQSQSRGGLRTYVVDLLGQAAQAESTFETTVERLGETVKSVEAREIILLGHSMGAWPVCTYLAGEHPDPRVKGAVLVAPAVPPLPPSDLAWLALAGRALALPPRIAGPFKKRLAASWKRHGAYGPGDVPWLIAQARQLSEKAPDWCRPEEVRVPVLSVLFADDKFSTRQRQRRLLQGVGWREVHVLPGEHTPRGADVDRLGEEVRAFAARVCGA